MRLFERPSLILSCLLAAIPLVKANESRPPSGDAPLHVEQNSAIPDTTAGPVNRVLSVFDVSWEQLNPARGDMSPRAGTLWGDRQGAQSTGFLVRFADGFSSPPHIHNVSYRAVVISGLIHNDDPAAEEMWMPSGSFWTQPRGEVHITAARGAHNLALVEIDEGPYLVMSPEEAFDSGETPINVDTSDIIWEAMPGEMASTASLRVARLWGKLVDGQASGSFIRMPTGFSGIIQSHGDSLRAVVIQGQLQYRGSALHLLEPGSHFSSQHEFVHHVSSMTTEVILYVSSEGTYEILPGGD